MRVSITTLGCKVNQFESQAMETLLSERGHTLVQDGADACIINSCAVTGESARKSRQAVRSAKEKNPGALIALCGCMSQIEPDKAALDGADIIFGSVGRREFLDELEKAFKSSNRDYGTKRIVHIEDTKKKREFERLPAGRLSGRTRAMLKVQDGCSNFCAYCIIPYSRGAVRSLPLSEATNEAKRLFELGIKELIVTGIEIASYGKDLNDGSGLAELIGAVSCAVPKMRIRIGSLEPRIVTGDFVDRLKVYDNIMPHFHLSLQSGCDDTLKRMNRRYDTARFFESVKLLREAFPGCGISADLIVGFPGESENEFNDTLNFINKCCFSSMHIFPFSSRSGTAAAEMTGHVSKEIKKERAKLAVNTASGMKNSFLLSCIGSSQSVLFEHCKNGKSTGHAGNNALVEYDGYIEAGEIQSVRIKGAGDGKLFV